MKVYSIEIFDTKLNYVATRLVTNVEVEVDYLTQQANVVEVEKLENLQYGYYIYIREMNYQGFITTSETVKDTTTITFKHLLALCDFDIRYKYIENSSKTLENQIKLMLEELSKKEVCELATRINVLTATTNTKMNLKSQTQNILSVLIKAMKMYAVAVNCKIDFKNKELVFNVGTQKQERTFEMMCEYVQDYTITIEDTTDYATSMTVFQCEEDENGNIIENEKIYYYDEYDNSITTTPVKRILPARHTTQEITTQDFETDAYETAYSKLYRSEFNNVIEVEIDKENKILEQDAWRFGELVNVITKENVYRSIYSGYRKNSDKVILILGAVRTELTKKMLIEKRSC